MGSIWDPMGSQITEITQIRLSTLLIQTNTILIIKNFILIVHSKINGKVPFSNCIMDDDLAIPPDEYICPVLGVLMTDPVITSCGSTYEREAIAEWLNRGRNTDPLTNQIISSNLIPNIVLRHLIESYKTKLIQRRLNRLPYYQSSQVQRDKYIAMLLYRNLNGENWRNSTNWNTPKPLNDWYGIEVDLSTGRITRIILENNHLKGK